MTVALATTIGMMITYRLCQPATSPSAVQPASAPRVSSLARRRLRFENDRMYLDWIQSTTWLWNVNQYAKKKALVQWREPGARRATKRVDGAFLYRSRVPKLSGSELPLLVLAWCTWLCHTLHRAGETPTGPNPR